MERVSNRHSSGSIHTHSHSIETRIEKHEVPVHIEKVIEKIVEIPVEIERQIFVDRVVEKVVEVEADISHVEDKLILHEETINLIGEEVDSLTIECEFRRKSQLRLLRSLRDEQQKYKKVEFKLKLAVGVSLLLSIIALMR